MQLSQKPFPTLPTRHLDPGLSLAYEIFLYLGCFFSFSCSIFASIIYPSNLFHGFFSDRMSFYLDFGSYLHLDSLVYTTIYGIVSRPWYFLWYKNNHLREYHRCCRLKFDPFLTNNYRVQASFSIHKVGPSFLPLAF
jgi:hypothetical protein